MRTTTEIDAYIDEFLLEMWYKEFVGTLRFRTCQLRFVVWPFCSRKAGWTPSLLSQQRHPGLLLLVKNNQTFSQRSLDYLRRADAYEATTYRGYEMMMQKLLPSHEALSQTRMIAVLLDKLGWAVEDQRASDEGRRCSLTCLTTFVETLQVAQCRRIRGLNKNELLALLSLLAGSVADSPVGAKYPDDDAFVKYLDAECARRIAMWCPETCLLVADLWAIRLGHEMAKTTYFNVLMREWHLMVNKSDVNRPRHLIQLLCYVGMTKTSPQQPHLMTLLQKTLQERLHAEDLEDEEMAIACQGFFKSRTKVTFPVLLEDVASRLRRMAVIRKRFDLFHAVCFIKVLRHSGYHSGPLYVVLSDYLKSHGHHILEAGDLVECAHFVAFFADGHFYDRTLFVQIENAVLRNLDADLSRSTQSQIPNRPCPASTTHVVVQYCRLKDVARILWAISEVMHAVEQRDFWTRVISYLRWRARGKQLLRLKDHHHFVDCLHSLAVVGIFPLDLIQLAATFQFKAIGPIPRLKPVRQLQVIIASANLELNLKSSLHGTSLWVFNHNPNCAPDSHMWEIRDVLHTLCKANTELYRMEYLLQHISFPGLEVVMDIHGNFHNVYARRHSHAHRIAVEVLELSQCLQNRNTAAGLFQMKIRQLKILQYKVVVILPEEIKALRSKSVEEKTSWLFRNLLQSVKSAEPAPQF